jgi:hypothetical protein
MVRHFNILVMQELAMRCIPAPFHPALATLLPALAASMAFPIQSIFHIIDILLNLFTILDSSGLF